MDVWRLFVKLLPRLLWVTALVLLLVWLMEDQGLTYDRQNITTIIKFHFFFMCLAWPVFMVEAILSYRAPLITLHNRRWIKFMHATLQTLVGLFIILGLVFIEDFKSLSHEAHFFSLHSWVGIISIAIYFGQYLSGLHIYLLSKWEEGRKEDFYPIHRFLGATSLITGFMAILLGLMEDQAFVMYAYGGITAFFDASQAHAFKYEVLAAIGLVLFLLVMSVMFTFLVFKEQAAVPSSQKEGVKLPCANGAAV